MKEGVRTEQSRLGPQEATPGSGVKLEARHTPGPWDTAPAGRIVATCGNVARSTVWADLAVSPLTEEDVRANARLIAAAPDLLEAAKMLASLAHFGPDGRPDGRSFPTDEQCSFARAAVSKALGQ